MKSAVAFLEPLMDKLEGGEGSGQRSAKAKFLIATVKGDVHDIGKNLVDIILTNNGYEVHNLGIKVAITEMIDKALEIGADAILIIVAALDDGQMAEIEAAAIEQGMDVLVYHPDGRWLSERGLNAEKGGGIDIPDINGFLMNVGQQPGMILHELTHAYHWRALGEKNEDIVRAYQNAKSAGLYAQVKSVDGSVGAAYASNNEKEYFAEITEAYFLKNDFFPFTREELRSYDPGGYALVENLWLKR